MTHYENRRRPEPSRPESAANPRLQFSPEAVAEAAAAMHTGIAGFAAMAPQLPLHNTHDPRIDIITALLLQHDALGDPAARFAARQVTVAGVRDSATRELTLLGTSDNEDLQDRRDRFNLSDDRKTLFTRIAERPDLQPPFAAELLRLARLAARECLQTKASILYFADLCFDIAYAVQSVPKIARLIPAEQAAALNALFQAAALSSRLYPDLDPDSRGGRRRLCTMTAAAMQLHQETYGACKVDWVFELHSRLGGEYLVSAVRYGIGLGGEHLSEPLLERYAQLIHGGISKLGNVNRFLRARRDLMDQLTWYRVAAELTSAGSASMCERFAESLHAESAKLPFEVSGKLDALVDEYLVEAYHRPPPRPEYSLIADEKEVQFEVRFPEYTPIETAGRYSPIGPTDREEALRRLGAWEKPSVWPEKVRSEFSEIGDQSLLALADDASAPRAMQLWTDLFIAWDSVAAVGPAFEAIVRLPALKQAFPEAFPKLEDRFVATITAAIRASAEQGRWANLISLPYVFLSSNVEGMLRDDNRLRGAAAAIECVLPWDTHRPEGVDETAHRFVSDATLKIIWHLGKWLDFSPIKSLPDDTVAVLRRFLEADAEKTGAALARQLEIGRRLAEEYPETSRPALHALELAAR